MSSIVSAPALYQAKGEPNFQICQQQKTSHSQLNKFIHKQCSITAKRLHYQDDKPKNNAPVDSLKLANRTDDLELGFKY